MNGEMSADIHPIPAARVERVSLLESEDALIVVDTHSRIHAISDGLCQRLGLTVATFQGKSLDQIERQWRKVAILSRIDSGSESVQGGFLWPSELSAFRVLPRIDVLLQGSTPGLPQTLTCDHAGQIKGASASLLSRPGGGLLLGRLKIFDLLPSATKKLGNLIRDSAQRQGVPSTMGLQVPNMGLFRLLSLAYDEWVELSFLRPQSDVLSLSELVRHPVFSRTIDMMEDAVSVHDLDGATVEINQAGFALLDAEPSAAGVPQLVEAIHPEDRSVFAGALAAGLRGATTRATLRLLVGVDDREARVRILVRPIRREDGELDRLLIQTRTSAFPAPPATGTAARVGVPLEQPASLTDPNETGARVDAAATSAGVARLVPRPSPPAGAQGYAWSCELEDARLVKLQLRGEGFEQLHGFPFCELVLAGGERIAMPHGEAERVRSVILEAARRGGGFELEFSRYDGHSALRWTLVRGTVYRDREGRSLVEAVTMDLEPRRLAQVANDQHHRFLLDLLELVPDAGGCQLRYDWQARVEILYANDRLRELCPSLRSSGGSAAELLFPNLEAPTVAAIDQRLRQSAETGELVDLEFNMGAGEGARWFSLRACRADAANGLGVVCLLMEITRQRRAVQTLLEREQLLQRIGNNMPNGFVFQMIQQADKSAHLSYVSAGFERLTGISRRDVAINLAPLLQLMSATDAMNFEARMSESARRMVLLECEFGLNSERREAFRHLMLSARPRPFDGGATLWEGVATDITQRHNTGEEKRRLILRLEHQITELESVNFALSHDLKGAVLGLRGQLDLALDLSEMGEHEGVHERLNRSIGVTERMWQLLAQMLELSRLERAELVVRRLTMLELVQPTLDLLSGLSEKSGVRVELETPELELDCDVLRLQSVLVNLIGNALKFSPPGSESVLIRGTEGIGEVLISITDHGIGIAPQHLEKVFGLFERVDQAVEGSGVGLALVRRVIQMHGGRVWATSPGVGQGTTIWLSLPRMSVETGMLRSG